MNRANVVLTGLPRSGTTLTFYLLNKLPNTVALHEPISPGKFADLEGEDAIRDGVEKFFQRMRRMALEEGKVISKHVGGHVPDNSYRRSKSEDGLRSPMAERGKKKGKIDVDKELGHDFLLVIKSPAMFSALLPTLVRRFPAYAIVRNPLAILASWNSINHYLYVLSWWYKQFCRTLPESHIIRYEEIVASGGAALSAITPAAKALDEPLLNRNLNVAYDREVMRELGSQLLGREGAYWRFYPRESVEKLLEVVT
jgi:hypothetical protein